MSFNYRGLQVSLEKYLLGAGTSEHCVGAKLLVYAAANDSCSARLFPVHTRNMSLQMHRSGRNALPMSYANPNRSPTPSVQGPHFGTGVEQIEFPVRIMQLHFGPEKIQTLLSEC